jgi:antirestriction protein ArdC
MNKQAMQQEALTRAVSSPSTMNYAAIVSGFMDKGIPESDILPRENVFTFNAWRALGRTVKKGEHGVKVVTFVPVEKKDKDTGEVVDRYRKPHTTTVFHVSQTIELAPVKS